MGCAFAPPTYDFGNVFTNFYYWANSLNLVVGTPPGMPWSQKTPEMNELEADLRAAKIWVRNSKNSKRTMKMKFCLTENLVIKIIFFYLYRYKKM